MTTNAKDICICGEHIDQHTSTPTGLICPDGIHEFDSADVAVVADDGFDRHAYLSLADEFDTMGLDADAPLPQIADFNDEYVDGARRFAKRLGVPLPWMIQSMDNALEYVRLAERGRQATAQDYEDALGSPSSYK